MYNKKTIEKIISIYRNLFVYSHNYQQINCVEFYGDKFNNNIIEVYTPNCSPLQLAVRAYFKLLGLNVKYADKVYYNEIITDDNSRFVYSDKFRLQDNNFFIRL